MMCLIEVRHDVPHHDEALRLMRKEGSSLRGTVTARVFVFIFGEILFETVVEIARVSQCHGVITLGSCDSEKK